MSDSTLDLIKSVIALFKNDSVIKSYVGNRIYTNSQQQVDFPFIIIRVDTAEHDTKDRLGKEHTLQVQAFSRKASPVECLEIRKRVVDLLNRQEVNLLLDNNYLINITFNGTMSFFKESDGITWQAITRFRVVIDEEI